MLPIRFTKEEYDQLDENAKRAGRTKSDVIRQLVREWNEKVRQTGASATLDTRGDYESETKP